MKALSSSISCLASLFAFICSSAVARDYPQPNTGMDPRLAIVWQVTVQDVCVANPNKNEAWDLTPAVVENENWLLNQNGTCMDQKGNSCVWNYSDSMIQIIFSGRARTYFGNVDGDFLGISGVVRHDNNPKLEGCWRAMSQQIASTQKENRPNPVSLPDPIYNLPPTIYASPN